MHQLPIVKRNFFNRRLSDACSLLIIFLLLMSEHAVAKKEKEKDPTAAPSMEPTASSSPSASPTKFPTLNPTSVPSELPSLSSAPSPSETATPTLFPSLLPSVMPTKSSSDSPTEYPARSETATPTIIPSITPTITPTQSDVIVHKVRLPNIGIDLIVSDAAAESKTVQELESGMTEFFEDVLEGNSGVESFDYVVLDFDVIQSSFNRRRLETGLSLRIDGMAFYGSRPPTAEDLAIDLRAYFAVWGLEDLVKYLHANGLPSAELVSVVIEGDAVKPAGGSGYKAGASIEQPKQSSSPTISQGIIAGLAAGCTVLAAAVVALLLQTRRCRKSRSSRVRFEGHREADDTPPKIDSDTEMAASPPNDSQTQTAMNTDDSDEQSVDGVSVDLSLYTTDGSLGNAPAPGKVYDMERLDKVIAIAKKHSDIAKKQSTENNERLAI